MKTATLGGRLLEIIEYDPRPHQRELDALIWKRASEKAGPQFFVPVWHRRAGKSSSWVNILIKHASSPQLVGQYVYLYPVQKKLREHIWDNPEILPKYLPMSQVAKKDDQRMTITFRTGSQIIFDGADEDPHKHRGSNARGWVVDEYDDQKPVIFDEIIRPILRFNKGWSILGGTPRGIKQLNEGYKAGQDPTRPQWWSNLLPANVTRDAHGLRLISDEELEEERRDMEAKGIGAAFRQEYFCDFLQDANQVFRNIDRACVLKPQEPIVGHTYRIGSDPAITTDYWVNSVVDRNTMQEVELERFQPHSTALGEARTEALYRKYNQAEVLIDSSGLGRPIADHLRDRGVDVLDYPTGTNKERLITNLSHHLDSLDIHFLDDIVAKEEMRAFSFTRTPLGRYQFASPEGKHDDTVIARGLAVWDIGAPVPLPDAPGYLKDARDQFFKRNEPVTNTHYGKANARPQ